MTQRLISILTPFYNSEEFMEIPHKSLINQTYTNWEWICVDDKSTDNTLNILRQWEQEDSRIKVVAREKNGGNTSCSMNTGLNYCSGSYIQILGHDDELTPETLEEIVKRIDETGADIIIPDAEVVNSLIDSSSDNFKMIAISPDKNDNKYPANDRSIILTGTEACKLSVNWRICTASCYEAELIKSIRFYEKGMNGDEYSAREFLLNAKKVAFSKGTYRYLRRPTSITSKLCVKYFGRFDAEEKLQKLVREKKFGKKYEKIANCGLLAIYFNYLMKYSVNENLFTKEEKQQIKEIMKYGKKLIWKYCSIGEIFINIIKCTKYKLFYNLWKKLNKKLKQKAII